MNLKLIIMVDFIVGLSLGLIIAAVVYKHMKHKLEKLN